MTNYIYGLGGRDITVANLKEIFTELVENAKAGKRIGAVQRFINLRGPELKFFE
jgi:pyruvate ferredoxin oxidoreductase alpha subunit